MKLKDSNMNHKHVAVGQQSSLALAAVEDVSAASRSELIHAAKYPKTGEMR